jgi:translation initiation factor IF-1
VVLAVLPGALYSVRLEDGQTVRAGLSSEARRAIVRLLSGNRVVVRLSSVDPHRGRIIQKL